jgi:F0F1-type ATP synthase assembly protein I
MLKKPFTFGRELAEATAISVELVVPVILGVFVGYKLDQVLKTYPFCLIAGVVLGGISGLWTVYKVFVIGQK